jgi:uncharacterized protein (TIGR03032 family)
MRNYCAQPARSAPPGDADAPGVRCALFHERVSAPPENRHKAGMTEPKAAAGPAFSLFASRLFTAWLREARAALVFTTYQAGKVFAIGLKEDGRLSTFERTFPRAMGLAADDRGFYMTSLSQIVRFENYLGAGETHDGHDALYAPLKFHTTGDIDVHDMIVGPDGAPIFAATLFNCLATIDDRHSFAPFWKPRFIDRLAAEDRCHLNGLAGENGRARFVTAVAECNVAEGWRDKRREGGIVIDVASGEIAARGLSMPHSPRLCEGRLYLLNAGTGEIGRVDLAAGRFEPIAFLPGFLRGMAILGRHALVGLSRPRENRTFEGLVLNERLAREGAAPQCGLAVVDLATGDVAHSLRIEGVVEELYDVAALPGVIRPALIGVRGDEIRLRLKPARPSWEI